MQQFYSPHQQYRRQKEQEVRTAGRVKLVVMLLEGAICFNKKAEAAMESGHRNVVLENVDRAAKIVMHLYESLNFEQGGKVSEQLASLYNYICDRYAKFVKGKLEDRTTLASVNGVLGTLLDAWKKIEENENHA